MKRRVKLFLIGGCVYFALEMLYKQSSHISMFAAGGTSLVLIDYVCAEKLSAQKLYHKCAAGSGIITSIEFVTGLVVNKALKLNVWDYSERFLNIDGQICPLFSVIWALLCIPALYICKSVKN